MQNPEPAVEFETVANKKQQHEVNVGKIIYLSNHHISCSMWILSILKQNVDYKSDPQDLL